MYDCEYRKIFYKIISESKLLLNMYQVDSTEDDHVEVDNKILDINSIDEDIQQYYIFHPQYQYYIDVMIFLYRSNYMVNNLTDVLLLKLIIAASYLDSTKLQELLIILHFRMNRLDLLDKLNLYNVRDDYNNLHFLENMILTFISYNMIDPLLLYKNFTRSEYILACKYGNLELIQWIHSNINNYPQKNDLGFTISCEFGFYENAKWFYSFGTIDITANDNRSFRLVCHRGHLEMAKWIYSINSDNISFNRSVVFSSSCATGQFEVIKWLKDISGPNIFGDANTGFKWSCSQGHLDIAKWIYEHEIIIFNDIREKSFEYACLNGHYEVAKWLVAISGDSIIKHDNFRAAYTHGHFKITKWLYDYDFSFIDDPNELFIDYCKCGKLEIAQWIYTLGILHVAGIKETCFIAAASSGHLHVLQWLNIFNINYSYSDYACIRLALYNGNLEVCQWLHNVCNINIRNVDEDNFYRLCKYNYIMIIEWLYSIGKIRKEFLLNRQYYTIDQSYSKIKYWLFMRGEIFL